MTSFEFADSPTSVTLMASSREGKPVQTRDVLFSLRNRTARSISARTSVQADSATKADWFLIDGAAPATPGRRDLDIEPNTTTGVKVTIAVPPDAPAGRHLFRVRVAAEDDPDDDFADSPAVAFATPEPALPVKPARRFPWWLVAIVASVMMAIMGGSAWWTIHHRGPHDTRGELGDDATRQLTSAGYRVTAVTGAPAGKPRNTVIDQVNDPDGKQVKLVLDPGTPKDVTGEPLDQARKDLDGYAIETTYGNPTGKARDMVTDQTYDSAANRVTLALDPGPSPVPAPAPAPAPKDVRGEPLDQARKVLSAYQIETTYGQAPAGKPRDTVIDQTYDPGRTEVVLTLDIGPPKNVRGERLDQARSELESSGYSVTVTPTTAPPSSIVSGESLPNSYPVVVLCIGRLHLGCE